MFTRSDFTHWSIEWQVPEVASNFLCSIVHSVWKFFFSQSENLKSNCLATRLSTFLSDRGILTILNHEENGQNLVETALIFLFWYLVQGGEEKGSGRASHLVSVITITLLEPFLFKICDIVIF